ncbi:MAG: discoidin domain-containing protein [Luteimonas sp.]
MRCARATALRLLLLAIAVMAMQAYAQMPDARANDVRMLDGFDNAADWRVVASNQVTAALRSVEGVDGKALCVDYDFNGVSGYAGIQRDIAIDYPDNYAFTFAVRGDAPRNDLQFKLIDASGDNVWWVNSPRYEVPTVWTPMIQRKRRISRAWGPAPDPALRSSQRIEYTVYNSAGGKGSICFDNLQLRTLPPEDNSALKTTATAIPAATAGMAPLAVDGKPDTAWRVAAAPKESASLTLDLGKRREFGGLTLQWADNAAASDYRIALSDDGAHWREARMVRGGDGGRDDIALPESEARYLRITLDRADAAVALREAIVRPLSFAATANDFVRSLAAAQPRGRYPRGFHDEQPYWTILGIDGGTEQGLIGEDGAVEVGKSGFSIEPFVIADGKLVTWADAAITQSLQDGYLPIPSVDWAHRDLALKITAFAQGSAERSQLVARYRLTNTGATQRSYVLALAARPLQVNPPTQFLSTVGGVSTIRRLAIEGDTIRIDGTPRVRASAAPTASFASTLDAGDVVQRLARGDGSNNNKVTLATDVDDASGHASGALLYRTVLAPGASYDVDLLIPMTGGFAHGHAPIAGNALQRAVAEVWRGKLDRVRIDVPAQGQALVDTLRTATAHMLISRVGPRLQPGTRSYARSWIRDGAMISEGLLRMGRADVVRDYVDFYAPYQFKDGMVPCCVDDRGSDPVPENDSHGELVFSIAELYRYNSDKTFLAKMWPHVLAAYEYMEKLRLSERTEANRANNPAFYGMMPASISHEGYSAKPVHSYWDGFWALRGYKDAVDVARWLGRDADAERFAASRDQFSADLHASIRITSENAKLDYLAGSAELADFDPTSTTIALAPGGEQHNLPQHLLRGGFERYWREFETRSSGKREWKDYTPYEWRNVAAFVRLGWRERAWEATQFFFGDRTPQPWNQWAEVVSHTPRKPFFVGDLPHAWVGSDFVRAALDMFAYARESDDSIVLAAGVPLDWLAGDGVAIHDLRTPGGKLSYRLRSAPAAAKANATAAHPTWTLDMPAGLRLPKGGLVLQWPYAAAPLPRVTINGLPVTIGADSEIHIRALPATVVIGLGG